MLSLSQWALRGESDCDDMHGAEYIYVYKYMYREMFLCEFHNGHCVGRRTAMTCTVRNIYICK